MSANKFHNPEKAKGEPPSPLAMAEGHRVGMRQLAKQVQMIINDELRDYNNNNSTVDEIAKLIAPYLK
jgi:hypothetical protein